LARYCVFLHRPHDFAKCIRWMLLSYRHNIEIHRDTHELTIRLCAVKALL